jgi:hypothetical protein
MAPPTLSPSVIKNLGATFCKIYPNKLSEETPSKVVKSAAPSGKKQSRKSSKGGPTMMKRQARRSPRSKKWWPASFGRIAFALLHKFFSFGSVIYLSNTLFSRTFALLDVMSAKQCMLTSFEHLFHHEYEPSS